MNVSNEAAFFDNQKALTVVRLLLECTGVVLLLCYSWKELWGNDKKRVS